MNGCGGVVPYGEGYTGDGCGDVVIGCVCVRQWIGGGAEERVVIHTFFVGAGGEDGQASRANPHKV